jgi:hypothetical protein
MSSSLTASQPIDASFHAVTAKTKQLVEYTFVDPVCTTLPDIGEVIYYQ